MKKRIGGVLWNEAEIRARVKELAQEIANDYRPLLEQYPDKNLVLVGILNGVVPFLADLLKELSKHLPVDRLRYDTLAISSYGRGTSPTELRVEKDLKNPIEDFDVLVVEDIIDTGYTYSYLNQLCEYKGAKSRRGATLINKGARRKYDVVNLSFVGFEIKEDDFVIGWGLDADEQGRQLPFIAVIEDV
ncbi:hypoxanthine phosphoribosyltransferase [bacterium]|nr:MAG: hypoxanthine phosphoribosyltransferase [bacterium]